MFTDNTTKVNSEPPNGLNEDISNPYECDQTLNVSAGTLNLSEGLALQRHMASADNTSGPAAQRKERCMLQCALSSEEDSFAAQKPVASTGTPSSTTIDQDAPSTSTSQTTQESQSLIIPPGVEEEYHDIEVAHMEYDLYFGLPIP
ncbi:hypothetical protein Tco_0880458 [Tanacetum coccineum]